MGLVRHTFQSQIRRFYRTKNLTKGLKSQAAGEDGTQGQLEEQAAERQEQDDMLCSNNRDGDSVEEDEDEDEADDMFESELSGDGGVDDDNDEDAAEELDAPAGGKDDEDELERFTADGVGKLADSVSKQRKRGGKTTGKQRLVVKRPAQADFASS